MKAMGTVRARSARFDRKADLAGTSIGKAYCERTGAIGHLSRPDGNLACDHEIVSGQVGLKT